jgi:Mg-chelatase subunit ChlD
MKEEGAKLIDDSGNIGTLGEGEKLKSGSKISWGDAQEVVKSHGRGGGNISVLAPGGRAVAAGRKHYGPGRMAAMMIAVVMIGLGLVVGWLFLGRFLPQPVPRQPAQQATPSAMLSPGVELSPTEIPVKLLSVEEIGYDKDSDAIPDLLEEILGYSAEQNDCVRRLGCGDFPTVPRAKLEINLLFLLDASGSMTEKLEGVSRWDSAKAALLDLLDSGLPKFANVGLIVYGHKGSSSLSDQKVSCQGMELLDPLSGVDVERTQELVNEVEPKGWTPLTGALNLAGKVLEGKDFAQNFVILLSDGKETCGGDPARSARELYESGVEVVTNVVGLAVNEDERQQLELIAQSGGGRFFSANTRNELGEALVLAAEAIRLWDQVNQCVLDNLSVYGECINVQYLRSLNYVDNLRLYIGKNRGSVAGGGFIEKEYGELYWRIWERFNELRADNWEQYDSDLRKLYPR